MTAKEKARLKTVIYVGCGTSSVFDKKSYRGHLLQFFPRPKEWKEIRVDLNPAVNPDVVADACDLPFEDGSVDYLVCLACLEHIPEMYAGQALLEFHRVLRTGGEMIIQVPDLEIAAKMIVEGRGWEVLYDSDAGPIRALDLIYGAQQLTRSNPFMVHRTGFTAGSLALWLNQAGFDGKIDRSDTDLWAYVTKIEVQEKERDGNLGCLYVWPDEPAAV